LPNLSIFGTSLNNEDFLFAHLRLKRSMLDGRDIVNCQAFDKILRRAFVNKGGQQSETH
jgi:hypothetical protein